MKGKTAVFRGKLKYIAPFLTAPGAARGRSVVRTHDIDIYAESSQAWDDKTVIVPLLHADKFTSPTSVSLRLGLAGQYQGGQATWE